MVTILLSLVCIQKGHGDLHQTLQRRRKYEEYYHSRLLGNWRYEKNCSKVSLEGGRLNLISHFVFWYYDNMFCLSVCDETRATTVSPL